MNAYSDVNKKSIDNKGGIIMNGLLRVEARTGIDYLKRIERAGADFGLKKFANSSEREKDSIICEAFARQFVRVCETKLRGTPFSFNHNGNIVEVSREITLLARGKDKDGKDVSKKTSVKSNSLKILPMAVDENHIEYSLELDPAEYDEAVLVSRINESKKFFGNFLEYHIDIAENDKRAMKESKYVEFWEAVLPNKLMYKESDSRLLSDFIDVLKKHGMTDADGVDVVKMKEIYPEAIRVFPLFKQLSSYEQIKLLNYAYIAGRVEHSRDIHVFAKATFEVLARKDYHKTIIVDNRRYNKVQEFRHRIDGKCVAKSEIKLIGYEYKAGNTTLKTYFAPFDIWHVLTM